MPPRNAAPEAHCFEPTAEPLPVLMLLEGAVAACPGAALAAVLGPLGVTLVLAAGEAGSAAAIRALDALYGDFGRVYLIAVRRAQPTFTEVPVAGVVLDPGDGSCCDPWFAERLLAAVHDSGIDARLWAAGAGPERLPGVDGESRQGISVVLPAGLPDAVAGRALQALAQSASDAVRLAQLRC